MWCQELCQVGPSSCILVPLYLFLSYDIIQRKHETSLTLSCMTFIFFFKYIFFVFSLNKIGNNKRKKQIIFEFS